MKNKDLNILNKFNILYLEDDEDLLRHTTDVLEDFVNNIYAAKTSKEALEILKNKKIDVIISDILLENENGIDFLKLIKEQKGICIPTILTTAHTDTKYLLDAIKLKVENYIVKPINIKELLNSLHDILLPVVQEKEIRRNTNVIRTISAITDSKQVDIIKFIINNLDNNNLFSASYSDIMDHINISKPTLIKLFKELAEKNILVKVQHKTYRFNELALEEI
ncbi:MULTISPECIES: response regulator [Malaciobacter]|uniref:Replication protein RepL n=2 Tax=Malaciobacter TaxID=2321114 RepID=A0AB36ZU26_9BACT|nr:MULTISPECIES: response regulator [Malaciobacter]PHO09878.1 response regulator [Malaciobacter canalis]PPK60272.1 replication protein RepL [Malaciobacter marinus]QEE33497.1 two-component system response regulator [Malaciobacter canalis]